MNVKKKCFENQRVFHPTANFYHLHKSFVFRWGYKANTTERDWRWLRDSIHTAGSRSMFQSTIHWSHSKSPSWHVWPSLMSQDLIIWTHSHICEGIWVLSFLKRHIWVIHNIQCNKCNRPEQNKIWVILSLQVCWVLKAAEVQTKKYLEALAMKGLKILNTLLRKVVHSLHGYYFLFTLFYLEWSILYSDLTWIKCHRTGGLTLDQPGI